MYADRAFTPATAEDDFSTRRSPLSGLLMVTYGDSIEAFNLVPTMTIDSTSNDC